LLDGKGIDYAYREYVSKPLSRQEIEAVLKKLKLEPRDVLRKNDKAYKELGLTGGESAAVLVRHMAAHPTLLQRPIGVAGRRAVVGRPVEKLLEIA
jgi:arsenate reductase